MDNLKNKTVLIVGGGFGQIPAIKKALDLNLKVVVVDKNPEAPGMKLAHYSYPVDIIDIDGVLEIAKMHSIDGVLTMQTDLPIPTIGAINDELNLNGVSYATAISCSHKMETRKLLKQQNVSQPDFVVVKSVEEAYLAAQKINYPVIIKAVDSSGSRGVTKVTSENGIFIAFEEALKYTRQKEVLVEEFIDGNELGAQAFSVGGKCVKVLLHNDTIANGEFMVPTGHSFPISLSTEEKNHAEKAIVECVEALGIKEGPSNIDLIIDTNGKAKIIEVGARIGATCLPELVYHYSGIDWVEITILNALNCSFDILQKKEQPCAAVILESNEDGILTEIEISESVTSDEDLLELEVTEEIGNSVSKLRKGTDRIGKLIVIGISAEEAEMKAEELKMKIKFHVGG
ncbi:ATP-grasp domain-containing protein [Labilibaculum euxinus]